MQQHDIVVMIYPTVADDCLEMYVLHGNSRAALHSLWYSIKFNGLRSMKHNEQYTQPGNTTNTVKPLNSGHIEDRILVRCREVVPISEVDWLATPPIYSSLIGFNAGGCGLQDAESANLDQTRSE